MLQSKIYEITSQSMSKKKKREIITRKPGANNFDERNDTYGPNANENREKERRQGAKEARLILNNEE